MRSLLVAALLLASTPAAAQTVDGQADAKAQSNTSVVAQAITGAGDSSMKYKGLYGVLGGTTSVMPGSSNSNAPCALASSRGFALGPIGYTKTQAVESEFCLLERKAGIMMSLGMDANMALATLCEDVTFSDAVFMAQGIPCIGQQDNERYYVNGAPATSVYRIPVKP